MLTWISPTRNKNQKINLEYMDDVIMHVVQEGILLNQANQKELIISVYEQLYVTGNYITEKQNYAVIIILNKNIDLLSKTILNINDLLSKPKWKNAFRVINQDRSITVNTINGQEIVSFKTPYDKVVIEDLKMYGNTVHSTFRSMYDSINRTMNFKICEDLFRWLIVSDNFDNFEVDEKVSSYTKDIENILCNLDNYMPILDYDDGFVIRNTLHEIDLKNKGLYESIIVARNNGVTEFSDSVTEMIGDCDNCLIRTISNSPSNRKKFINSMVEKVDIFEPLIKFSGMTMISLGGENTRQSFIQWFDFLKSIGIDEDEIVISPDFRIADKNYMRQYVKNDKISTNTKVVFIGPKIPEEFISSDLRFSSFINTGSNLHLHYTTVSFSQPLAFNIHYSNSTK